MESKIEEIGPCKKRLAITVPAAEVLQELEKGFREASRYARIPGFRPGKAPRALLEKKFGASLRQNLKEQLVEDSWKKALDEHSLEPMGDPEVEGLDASSLDETRDLSFSVTFDVFPVIELGDLSAVKVKKNPVAVSEAEVDQELDNLAVSRARWEPAPGAEVTRENRVEADLEFHLGEERLHRSEKVLLSPLAAFPGADPEEYMAKLLGRKAGEESRIPLVYPADFRQEKARGQAGEARVAIHEVMTLKKPEVDDTFAAACGAKGGVEELRQQLSAALLHHKETQEKRRLEEEITDLLLADHPFDLPPSVVESQLEARVARAKAEMEAQGLPAEEVATRLASLRESGRDKDVRAIKRIFLMRQVAKREKIYVLEEDVNRAIRLMAAENRVPVDKMREVLESREMLPQLRSDLLEAKVLDYLRQKATLVED